jgi:large subunit ribosomal protein L30e
MARNSKNKSSDTLGQRLALVVKSGKISLGYKTSLKSLRSGKAKLILIAANTPPLRKSELECKQLTPRQRSIKKILT